MKSQCPILISHSILTLINETVRTISNILLSVKHLAIIIPFSHRQLVLYDITEISFSFLHPALHTPSPAPYALPYLPSRG